MCLCSYFYWYEIDLLCQKTFAIILKKIMVKLMSLEMFRKKVINTKKKKHEVTSPYIFSTERNTF
jgi:hypothetical protein